MVESLAQQFFFEDRIVGLHVYRYFFLIEKRFDGVRNIYVVAGKFFNRVREFHRVSGLQKNPRISGMFGLPPAEG